MKVYSKIKNISPSIVTSVCHTVTENCIFFPWNSGRRNSEIKNLKVQFFKNKNVQFIIVGESYYKTC